MSGLKIAALYGIIPHQLGFCGPQEKSATKILLKFLKREKSLKKKIRKILKEFKGAFIYYKFIARSNKISDPFDKRVVRAYWTGNKLLEKFQSSVILPFHAFHVLKVGSVTGRVVLKGKLLDRCRIGWGKVIKKTERNRKKGKIIIEYQPLVTKGKIGLGKPIKKEIIWDKKMVPEIKLGDWVSTHWGYAIQVLNREELANLKKYTQITLDIVNKNASGPHR